MKSRSILFFGGTSSERRVSVASAQHTARYLQGADLWFQAQDGSVISVDQQDLASHTQPFTTEFRPQRKLRIWDTLDSALNSLSPSGTCLFLAVHGGDGENGILQKAMEQRRLCFTGSGAEASALCFDKRATKKRLQSAGMLVAPEYFIPTGALEQKGCEADLHNLFREWKGMVLKPNRDGSSIGLHVVRSIEQLPKAIAAITEAKVDYLAEKLLVGRELTVGVIQTSQGLKALTASEACTKANANFDYEGKYLGLGTEEITPANISVQEMEAALEIGVLAHRETHAYGYSRSDMMLTSDGIYFLEINTLPGLSRVSFIPQQLAHASIPMQNFIDEQMTLGSIRYT